MSVANSKSKNFLHITIVVTWLVTIVSLANAESIINNQKQGVSNNYGTDRELNNVPKRKNYVINNYGNLWTCDKDETEYEDVVSNLKPSSCAEVQQMFKVRKSGIYTIYPKKKFFNSIQVYCDLETDGGEWTVIQRRNDNGLPRENFLKNWSDYKDGFGNLSHEFWLGNEIIHALTNQERVALRIDLKSYENENRIAEYDTFSIMRQEKNYKLVIGNYTGDAGDSFAKQKGMAFSTIDQDHDTWNDNCAKVFKGAWWYSDCHDSNLNGFQYAGKHETYADGIEWASWKGQYYSLKFVEMKMRPV